MRRRTLSFLALTSLLLITMFLPALAADPARPSGKKLGTIYNNDSNNIIWKMGKDREAMTPEVYRRYLNRILDGKPGVFAQDVGLPEGVLFPTQVDTNRAKYWTEVCKQTWPENDQFTYAAQIDVLNKLYEAGTDPLMLTVEACRKRGVPVLASFRMNSEDLYGNTWKISDFGRDHPECRISGSGCLDWAIPIVYEHRMKIFAEVASKYDIDGIEFDFRRWYHLISNPEKNHVVLTRLVRETRKMLDETAREKGRPRPILGVRVGPMLEGPFKKEDFPGCEYGEPTNASCKTLGLDVSTWVKEGLVDYISPMLFEPLGLPKTREFVELAKGTEIGVYPTISYMPCGSQGPPSVAGLDNIETQRLHEKDICKEALKCYDDGADGVSLYNWFQHHWPAQGEDDQGDGVRREWSNTYGPDALGYGRVQQKIMPNLSNPESLRALLNAAQ